ncbi:MAG: hypothetical protein ABSG10_01510 [Terracidiphilus sp.]|jgi:membrane protein implicated in regulation of membrane protease activity
MFYDARISMGMLFTLMGTVLTAFGVATHANTAVYAKCMGIDANLWWGLVLLVFGVVAMFLGRRAQTKLEKEKK